MAEHSVHPASYRDPSGFVFRSGDTWYRQVNTTYRDHYLQLMASGLYRELTEKGLLIRHREIEENYTGQADWFRTLLPEQLPFISYPEEWCPAQLKDAALCTLAIARIAIAHDMILKDATPRNIQFMGGKAVLIDSLSFERYDPAHPWVAYRQFCECFLYPLYLHRYHRFGTHRILTAWPEGIPAGIADRLLPFRSRRSLGVWLHVILPARIRHNRRTVGTPRAFDRNRLLRLLTHLEDIVRNLDTDGPGVRDDPGAPSNPGDRGWSAYYGDTILSQTYLQEKERLFREWVGPLSFSSALDLGANEGHFSRILAAGGHRVVAAEADWECVQTLHRQARGGSPVPYAGSPVHAVLVDIANPTPASGFDHRERSSFTRRAVSDLVTALALIHHLVLTQHIPLKMIAGYLAGLTRTWLIIEFVPLTDPKAAEMLRNKPVFPGPYDRQTFETEFERWFTIERQAIIPGTERTLYLLRKNNGNS